MITQVSPLFPQVMSLPVSTRAANEMAARASIEHARLTPMSTAKAVNATRNRATFLQALPDDGRGPGGGGIARERLMTPPRAAAGPASRAGRCTGGGEAALSSGR